VWLRCGSPRWPGSAFLAAEEATPFRSDFDARSAKRPSLACGSLGRVVAAAATPTVTPVPWRGERGMASCAAPPAAGEGQLPAELQVIPLPKLSHTMTAGRLVKWHKRAGDPIAAYDVIMEVEVDDLVEEVFKVDDFAGTVTMLVESQEDGYLAKVLVPEGTDNLPAGRPVAVFAETEAAAAAAAADGAPRVPTTDVYDDAQPRVAVLPWQSFLKQGSRKVKCMG